MSNEHGPIYGVPLIDHLPLGRGSMRQAMPDRADLEGVRDYRQGQRVVAGYEVLLWHYQRLESILAVIRDVEAALVRRVEAAVDEEK